MSTNIELMFLNIAKETYNLGYNGKLKYWIDNKLFHLNYRIAYKPEYLLSHSKLFFKKPYNFKLEM